MKDKIGMFVEFGFDDDKITGRILSENEREYEIAVLPEMEAQMKLMKAAVTGVSELPSEHTMASFLSFWDRNGAVDCAKNGVLELYHEFAEILSERNIPEGLSAKAYGCYGGYNSFECDWDTSRDCLLKLLEVDYKPFYANTLGYIYYYGRCNNGVPQYAEAYKYFSMAAFAGNYEAKYKIADMFLNGYFVRRDPQTAYGIIRELYDDTRGFMTRGEFMSSYPNVALRMCRILSDILDISDRSNACEVYRYALEAEFAIRARIYAYDENYGDEKVLKDASKLLGEIREKCHALEDWDDEYYYTPGLVKLSMPSDVIRMQRRGKRVTFTTVYNELDDIYPRFFVTIPDLDICGLYDEIVFEAENGEEHEDEEILFDRIEGRDFFHHGRHAAEMNGNYQLVYPVSEEEPEYRVISVRRGANDPAINCICENDAGPGDRVRVTAKDGDFHARVEKARMRKRSELEAPLEVFPTAVRVE